MPRLALIYSSQSLRRVPILVPGLDPARCVATCRVADDGNARPRARVARGRACVHLGAATGASVLVHCHTCRGNVRKKHAVHVCALHGECLPTAPAAATGVLPMKCALCGHNPAKRP